MSKGRTWKALTGASLLAMAIFGSGCAQDVGDIDRTQPNKLKKSTFLADHEWYFRQTVTNTDTQGSMIFEGYQSNLKRVKFFVTENTLFACTTVMPAEGEFIKELADEKCYGVVAAFPIMGHFDVQRAYNTATGEQSNLLVENYSDRPWFERDYMRVNWAINMVDGAGMFHGMLGRVANINFDIPQQADYVDPDRARIRPDEGYIESTSAYTYEPDIYACFDTFGDGYFNCEGGQVRVKNSFVRVPDEPTFEPFIQLDQKPITEDGTDLGRPILTTTVVDPELNAQIEVECTDQVKAKLLNDFGSFAQGSCAPRQFDYFNRYGFFRTENTKYDEQYGGPEFYRRYYANHWNIWQSAYKKNDATGEYELLDPKERVPKPIVYHFNAEYPRDMIDAAKVVEKEWDAVFKEAVRLAKGYSTIAEVEEELEAVYGDKRMYKIEDNSCLPNKVLEWSSILGESRSQDRSDPKAILSSYIDKGEGSTNEDKLWSLTIKDRKQLCAELEYATELRPKQADRFDYQRAGDLRYSFFYWVEEFNNYWSGYGPSSADPTTGQIISGSAHMAGTSLRRTAAYAADLVRYMNGELSDEAIINGTQVRDYLKDVETRQQQTMTQALSPQGKREFVMRTGENPSEVSKTNFTRRPTLAEAPEVFRTKGVKWVEKEAGLAAQAALMAKKEDTRFLDFVSRPDVKSLMLADPKAMLTVKALAAEQNRMAGKISGDFTEEDLDLAYKKYQDPSIQYARSQRFHSLMSEQNIMTSESLKMAVENLVTYRGVADSFKGKSRDEIQRYFLEKMFVGTQLHEVGHTLGLRHNFNSSLDALNYHDEWWKIQEMINNGELTQAEASRITDKATIAKITDADVDYLNEAEFRLGSVMDYTQDLTGRFAGLGKYDQAAINFIYGHSVPRWKDDVKLPVNLSYELFVSDYSELPEVYSGMPATADPKMRRQAGINNIVNGREWINIKAAQQEIRSEISNNTNNWLRGEFSEDDGVLPWQDRLVPYNFCSDERQGWQLGCSVFDWGSNQREIVNHSFNTYRYMQTFWRSKRHNTYKFGENLNYYANRVFSTFGMIERPFLFYSIYQQWDLGLFTDSLREAAIDAANFYTEVLAMPEPGRYCKLGQDAENSRTNKWWYYNIENTYVPANMHVEGAACADFLDVQPGTGHYFSYDITDEYDYRVAYVGTFIDKVIAVNSLFNVSSNFLFSNFVTDSRATFNSYWTIFQNEMLGTLRGLILNDYTDFGGVYDPKTQAYQPPMMVDRNAFAHGLEPEQRGAAHIFTPLTFNHEFNAMVYGILTNSTYADRNTDFAQYLKVAVDNTEIQDWGTADLHEFVHPITHQRYIAPQTGDNRSISVEIVQWANRLKTRWEDSVADYEQQKERYDLARTSFGANFDPNTCIGAAAITDAQLKDVCDKMTDYETSRANRDGRRRQMEDVAARLDQIRFIFGALGPNALR